jgi:hypothetical protein
MDTASPQVRSDASLSGIDSSPNNNDSDAIAPRVSAPVMVPERGRTNRDLVKTPPEQWYRRGWEVCGYLRRERAPLTLISLLAFLASVLVALAIADSFAGGLSIAIALCTFCVGIAIFFGEGTENRQKLLPKRLTVFFLDPDGATTRMVCYRAQLSGESDSRALGQQIGAQISGHHQRLEFSPFIDVRRLGIQTEDSGESFVHFLAIFHLREVPAELGKELALSKDSDPDRAEYCKVLRREQAKASCEPSEQHAHPV